MWVFYSELPAGIYLFKVNSENTRTLCEISSKLTKKITQWRHWNRSGAFTVNFEQISHIVLMFLLSVKFSSRWKCLEVTQQDDLTLSGLLFVFRPDFHWGYETFSWTNLFLTLFYFSHQFSLIEITRVVK